MSGVVGRGNPPATGIDGEGPVVHHVIEELAEETARVHSPVQPVQPVVAVGGLELLEAMLLTTLLFAS